MLVMLVRILPLPLACLCMLVGAIPLVSSSQTGTAISLTKRSRLSDNGVVNPDALQAHVLKATAKLSRGFENFKKNTGTVHPSDKGIRFSKRLVGGDNLTDDGNMLWQGTIHVGTPAVEFTVDFDTGSSDLFLPDINCKVNCAGHKLYAASKSSTAKDINKSFQLAFGDGSTVTGNQFEDTVSIAGLTAKKQRLGASLQYSSGFSPENFPADGLMGMGFEQISDFGASPVFQTLVENNQTTQPIFSFNLASNGSELFLGGVNPDKFTGEISHVPVTQVGFWQLDVDSLNVKGKEIAKNVSAIVDTGTTLMLGDPTTVAAIYSAIPGAQDASMFAGPGFFTFPCNANPSISVSLCGREFALSVDSLNLGQLFPGSNDCVGGLAASDGLPFFILGDVFLQNVYAVFDTGNKTIGFADLAPETVKSKSKKKDKSKEKSKE